MHKPLRNVLKAKRSWTPEVALLVDEKWYLQTNPDVAEAGISAINHYMSIGWAEGRNPCPLFDTEWYFRQYPDVEHSGLNPLSHYADTGWREGRDPHPLFDASYYLEQNPDVVAAGIDPLGHYLHSGGREERNPHPLFDSKWYLTKHPDATDMNPLIHYITIGAHAGCQPNPLFDPTWYRNKYPESAATALAHFAEYGLSRRLQPHPLFDSAYYLDQYPDVANAQINPLVHYLLSGSNETRKPNPDFDPEWYMRRYAARKNLPPLVDYLVSEPGSRFPNASAEPPPKIRVKRRSDIWDWESQSRFESEIWSLVRKNCGYFDRIPVSVVMPTRNRAASIKNAIESVLMQSFRNWELIIVDDGSDDNTLEVVAPYLVDPRVTLKETAHGGVSGARNYGLDSARGDLVFYLDSDNTWEKDFLQIMTVFLTVCDLDAAYCGTRIFNDDGRVTGFRGADFYWSACFDQNYIDMNCFCHKRSAVGGHRFDQSLKRLVDWDFILRMTKNARVAFAPYCGVNYYDGQKGGRITLTEYPGDQLAEAEKRIRAKHDPKAAMVAGTSTAVRWESALQNSATTILNDVHSTPFLRMETTLINWIGARNRNLQADLVSIVVLCYGNSGMTKECIQSVLQYSASEYNIEVIAVDNNSPDDTWSMLQDLAKSDRRVRPLKSPGNLMFSLGNNYGCQQATGQYVVLLNNDTLVTEGWLAPLIDPLRLDATIGIVGPKLLYPDGTLQCGGLAFNKKSVIPYHIYRGLPADAAPVNKSRVFQALTGACVAFRTSEYFVLQGLDPAFINGCEDLDICLRMTRQLRKRALYNPASTVVHLESKSEGRGRFIARNREKFVQRWRSGVQADDTFYYEEDGFVATDYTKPGREPDGPAASYVPSLAHARLPSETTLQDRPINIGFVSIWHARGISFHTRQLAMALEGDQFKTHICARWESDKFSNDTPIHHPRVWNAGEDPSADEFVHWAKSRKIDALIFMESHPKDWKRIEAAKKAGFYIICYENPDVLRHEMLDRYGMFDALLFNCFHTRELMLAAHPRIPNLMLPWGAERTEHNIQHPAPDGNIRFVHVGGWGGLNNRKNTDLVIRAFSSANLPNAELYIFTQAPISSYGPEISAIISQCSSIHVFEGTIDDIRTAYRNKSMLLWPSKREGVGLPILEALEAGLPVLISDGYMMRQWVSADRHGVICKAKPIPGQMALPELVVSEGDLVQTLQEICRNPQALEAMFVNIAHDKQYWTWSWQPAVFRDELRKMLGSRRYRPSDKLGYVPRDVLEFEQQRRLAATAPWRKN